MKLRHFAVTLAIIIGAALPLAAQQKTYTPAPGTPLRQTFMDGLRYPVLVYYGKFFGEETPPVFTVRHLKVSGNWAYAEVTTQAVTVEPGMDLLENMSSLDDNAGSSEKAAKWTIDAWALYENNREGWIAVYDSTSEDGRKYEMSLDDGRTEAYKDMRKRFPKASAAIFPSN